MPTEILRRLLKSPNPSLHPQEEINAITYEVNRRLPLGVEGEDYLRARDRIIELKEDPRILDRAWNKRY